MKIGRNVPCHCGSGKKYKHCCYDKDLEARRSVAALERVESKQVPDTEVEDEAGSEQPAQKKLSYQQRQRLAAKGRNYPNSVSSKSSAQRGS